MPTAVQTFSYVELGAEVDKARQQRLEKRDRIMHSLVNWPNLKIIIVAMPAGLSWPQHSTTGRISVQVLNGRIRMKALEQTFELGEGKVLALESSIIHDVEALEDSEFLLTIAKTDA
jgi:quercetin dioxygenase-like cupin family protein